MLGALLNGRVSRLVVMSAVFVALSGLPAYAQSGGYYRHNQGNAWCQGGRRDQNDSRCQQVQYQPQSLPAPYQPPPMPVRGPDDGNSK